MFWTFCFWLYSSLTFLRFASETLTSDDFKEFFLDQFQGNKKIQEIDWDAWFYDKGMPPVLPELDQSMARASQSLADTWIAVDRRGTARPVKNEMATWSSLQITCFLDDLAVKVGNKPLKLSTLQAINGLYNFLFIHIDELLISSIILN